MTLYKTERVATNKNFGIGGLPAEYLKIKMFLKNALNLKAKQNMYVYSILQLYSTSTYHNRNKLRL
jgi:hypothetical protein